MIECWSCKGRGDGPETEGWLRHELSRHERAARQPAPGRPVLLGQMVTRQLASVWTCSIDCSVLYYEWLLAGAREANAQRQVDEERRAEP